jgi:anti-sigma factor RsiW
MDCDETRRWLTAHLDGELDLVRDADVVSHLKSCAACAAVVRSEAALRDALREKLPRVAPPPRLEAAIREQLRRETRPSRAIDRPPRWNWRLFLQFAGAAAVVCVALAVGAVWGAGRERAAAWRDALVTSHTRALTSGALTEVASSDRHTVKPWLAGHLNFSPPVVDLAAAGYPLVGGRAESLDREKIAALVYQRNKHVVTVLVWPAGDGPSLAGRGERLGYHVRTWRQADLALAAISDIPADELDAFSETFRAATQ